jgi:S1-C subfamily serine protease
MVAPGVALTARHVVDDMREKGFLGVVGGYLLALGFHKDGMTIWNPDSFGAIGDGDLSILTLVRATPHPATTIGLATLVARQPLVGESISLVGFAATEVEFENDAAIDLLGSVGRAIDVYPKSRDRCLLPNPSAAVSAKTIGGMSGGAAFDAQGRLIGIIASGIGEDPSLISLAWPCIFTPVEVAWPPGLINGPTNLHSMAQLGLCRIECIEALSSHVDENGEPLVSLIV